MFFLVHVAQDGYTHILKVTKTLVDDEFELFSVLIGRLEKLWFSEHVGREHLGVENEADVKSPTKVEEVLDQLSMASNFCICSRMSNGLLFIYRFEYFVVHPEYNFFLGANYDFSHVYL